MGSVERVSLVADRGALLLLSGGMDSIAVAHWIRPAIALTVDYGQRGALGEIRAAGAVADSLGLKHDIVRLDARALGSGDLAGTTPHSVAPVSEWWPFRNQLLVTIAAARAIANSCGRIVLGTVSTDSAHADGSEAFVTAMDAVLALQEGNIHLQAPAVHLTTLDLIRETAVPLELLAWAHSCHRSNWACGSCRGCKKHLEVRTVLWGARGILS
jgi:7-cyano-7-deazaguanine synthase